jgi:hypothetical protein
MRQTALRARAFASICHLKNSTSQRQALRFGASLPYVLSAEGCLRVLRCVQNFLWGVASAAHQVEGGTTNNQWAVFETLPADPVTGHPRTKHRVGIACDHWNRLKPDTKLIKDVSRRLRLSRADSWS